MLAAATEAMEPQAALQDPALLTRVAAVADTVTSAEHHIPEELEGLEAAETEQEMGTTQPQVLQTRVAAVEVVHFHQ